MRLWAHPPSKLYIAHPPITPYKHTLLAHLSSTVAHPSSTYFWQRGPKSWYLRYQGSRQTLISDKYCWISCINKLKPAQALSRRVFDKNTYFQTKTFLTHTNYMSQTQTFVTQTDCLWQTHTVCDRHRLSVTDTDCLWETQTALDWHKLSVTDRNFLWQKRTLFRHGLSLTDTDCTWQRLYRLDSHLFLSQINFKLIYALSRTIYSLKITVQDKKNPAYGRHRLSRPMRIIEPIYYIFFHTHTHPTPNLGGCEEDLSKLDGVGPLITDPPPTSSTTLSNFFFF